jgi:hypothetical protein
MWVSPDQEVPDMQDASSHHEFGFEAPNESRIRVGWVFAILALVPLVLLVIVAYDFATNEYITGEALFGRTLIGFFASIVVFIGLLATALIRSGKSGSHIDRSFGVGFVLALLGAFVGLSLPGGAGIPAFLVGGVGVVLMGVGAFKS